MLTRYSLVLFFAVLISSTSLLGQTTKEKSSYSAQPNLDITLVTPPTVMTSPALNITAFSAMLNGTFNPQGASTTAQYQWGQTTLYGNFTSLSPANSGNTNVGFNTVITSLIPNTQYHFRITATNGSGTTNGVDRSFTTLPVASPTVLVLPPTDIGLTSATLNGQVNPNGFSTDAWFTWGSDSLTNITSPVNVGSDSFFVFYSTPVTDLQPNTSYQYFASANGVGGPSSSANTMMFTTLASLSEYLPDGYTVGLYHLNDAKEFIQDYSGQENHGDASPDSLSGRTFPELVAGRYGNARDFDVLTREIQITNNSSLDFTDESFTIEAWVNPAFYAGAEIVLAGHGFSEDSTLAYQFKINPFYQLEVNLSESGTSQYQTRTLSSPLQENVWQHIAAVVDMANQVVQIYYNGVSQPVTTTGTYPFSLYISPTPTIVGSFGGVFQSSPGTLHCAIDEIRISNTSRQSFEFKIPGSITGIKFWDRVNFGTYDETTGDTVLGNWGIVLQQLPTNSDVTNTFKAETTFTDEFGFYAFTDLKDGTYEISEILQDGWVQTYPPGDGKYIETISGGVSVPYTNFGNADGYEFIDTSGGAWSDSSNWEGNQLPGNDTPVYFDSVIIVYDVPFDDSIGALRIGPGGRLIFSPTAKSKINSGGGSLYIEDKFEIDEGATVDGGEGNFWLYCDGDFLNKGTFNRGNSTVVFTGPDIKTIVYDPPSGSSASLKGKRSINAINGNSFFNLTISGTNTSTNGNVEVNNQLDLIESLSLSDDDTLSLENSLPGSLSGTGLIPTGTLKRKVTGNNQYRFESDESFVQFVGAGAPEYLSVTSQPSIHPDSVNLRWVKVNAVQNSVTNTFTAENVNHFSKWVFGKPGTGFRKGKSAAEEYITPKVSRTYTVQPEGGNNFNATIQLRYDDAEIGGDTPEDDLELAYGAFYVDSVRERWNMLSLPVVPDDAQKDSVFRNATSNAFRFDNSGGYLVSPSLTFGTGYWLKYQQDEEVSILGNDQTVSVVTLEEGWNMIGALSYPIDPSIVYFQSIDDEIDYLTSSSFFGYNNGYELAEELKPMRAYWLKVPIAGSLVLDLSTPPPSPKNSAYDLLNQSNSISFSDASGSRQSLYFTYNNNIDVTRFELPPTPPVGIFDARFSSGTMLEDISKQSSKIFPVTISSATTPLTISWKIQDNSGSANLLIDGKEIPLRSEGKITINNPSVSVALKLITTPLAGLPKSFALYQNFPNPFNPTTTVAFDIPQDELVTLKVYNILGQEIITAIDNTQFKAGHYEHSLNTTDWASGVYFYKLTAGSFNDIKKMVLTR